MLQLITRKQVSEYFAVKPTTVRKWQQRGKIKPYATINGRPRYRLKDLQHLIKIKTIKTGTVTIAD